MLRVLRTPKIGRWLMVSILLVTFAVTWKVAKMSGEIKLPATFIPTTTSYYTSTALVWEDAARWVGNDPLRYTTPVSPDSSSMKPFFDSHSLPLCIKYVGQPIPNGTVVIFNRGDIPRVMHVVSDQTKDSVYMSGVNNHHADGWFLKSTIEGFVVGQLYLPTP